MKLKNLFLLTVFLLLAAPHSVFAKHKNNNKVYKLDADHSSVEFKIRHLLGKVSGRFSGMEGQIELDPDHTDTLKTSGKIDATTIDTGIKQRDDHLKSPDFFDVDNAKNPQFKNILFESTKLTEISTTGGTTKGKLHGDITIHGIKKSIVLDVTVNSTPVVAFGSEHIGMSATGTLNRKDFGLGWNKAIEAGGFVVGDEVTISIEAEATAYFCSERNCTPKK